MIYTYDGTFEGLLTTIFKIYECKQLPSDIFRNGKSGVMLFDEVCQVNTDTTLSDRVIKGLQKRISPMGIRNLYKVYLSEVKGAEMTIYGYIKYALENHRNIETDYTNEFVLHVKQLVKMIHREVHRMHAFVRFKLTKDGIYAATIVPDFDVIPLIGQHFRDRYADQRWLIYDVKRNYGLYYDLKVMEMITIDNLQLDERKQFREYILDDEELQFQNLWKTYFRSTNIKERENKKLHLQHVPKRYWKYLVEK